MAADADNLRIQQQINAAIAERGRLLSAQTSLISDQVELAVSFCKAMKCEGIDEVTERISEIRAGLESASRGASEMEDRLGGATAGLGRAAGGAGDLADAIDDAERATVRHGKTTAKVNASTLSWWERIKDSVSGLSAVIASVYRTASGMFEALYGVYNALQDVMWKAADASNQPNFAMEEALEQVRKEYGALTEGTAKQIVDSQKQVSAALSTAGLSIAKVYGKGEEGRAKMLLDTLELSKSLGPVMDQLGDKFSKVAGALVVFQKELGLSGEEMKGVAMTAIAMGQEIDEVLAETAKIADAMVEKFGGSSKMYAKDIAYMKAQSASFGKMTTAQMAAASVSVRKYGLELKDVLGITKGFEDFESAAEKSAQLAQMFGAYVDPIKMMKEEDPAKQFDMLRKSMLQAGQSVETMNKAQIKALATQTGMDENMVRLAFSSKNAGKSLGDIQKESEKAGKKQMSQEEILQKMGDNIERIYEAMSNPPSMDTGLFGALKQGFFKGIQQTKVWRDTLADMREAFWTVYNAAYKFGQFFVNEVPGVSDIISHFGESAKASAKMIVDMLDLVTMYFTMLKTDPVKAIKTLEKVLFDTIDNMFKPGGSKSGMSRLLKGAGEFAKALAPLVGVVLKGIGKLLAKGLEQITAFILKPPKMGGSGVNSFVSAIVDPLWDGLKVAISLIGPALWELLKAVVLVLGPKLWTAMKQAFSNAWDFLKDFAKQSYPKVVAAIKDTLKLAVDSIGKAISGFASKLQGKISSTIPNALKSGFLNVQASGSYETEMKEGFFKLFNKVFTSTVVTNSFVKAFPKVAGKLGMSAVKIGASLSNPVSWALSAAIEASDIDVKYGKALEKKLESGEIKTRGAAAGGKIAGTILETFTLGLMPDSWTEKAVQFVVWASDSILSAIRKISPSLERALSKELEGIFGTFAGVGDIIYGLLAVITGDFSEGFSQMGQGLTKVIKSLATMIVARIDLILGAVPEILTKVLDFFKDIPFYLAAGIGLALKFVFYQLPKFLWSVVKSIPGLVAAAGKMILKALKAIVKFFSDQDFRREVFISASGIFDGTFEGITSAWKGLADKFLEIFREIVPNALTGLVYAFTGESREASRKIVDDMLGSIKKWFADKITAVWSFITGLFTKAMGKIDEIKASAKKMGVAMWEGVKEGVSGILQTGKDVAKGFLQTIGAGWLIRSPSKATEKMGEQITAGLEKGLEEMPDVGTEAGQQAVEAMNKGLNTVDPAAMAKATQSLQAFKDIANAVGGIGDTKGIDAITNLISSLGSMFSNIPVGSEEDVARAPAAVAAIVGGIDSLLEKVGGRLKTIVPQLKEAFGTLSQSDIDMLAPRVEAVGGMLDVVSKFADATKEYQPTAEQIKTLQDAAANPNGIIPDGFAEAISKFGEFLNTPGKGAQKLIADLTALKFDPAIIDQSVKFLDDSLGLVTKFGEVVKDLEATKSGVAYDATWIGQSFTNLSTETGKLNPANLEKSLATLDKLGKVVEKFKTRYSEGVAEYLDAAVKDMKELDKVLSKIEINDLQTTVNNLNGALTVTRHNFEFEHKPVQVTINMQVTFNAQTFTRDIFTVAADIVKKDQLGSIQDLAVPSPTTVAAAQR